MALSKENRPAFNADIKAWAKQTKDQLAFRLASLDLESKLEVLERARSGRKPVADSLRAKVKDEFGQAEIVQFSFWLHGYFFDRGVGKDTPIAQAGSASQRLPKPWIDFVLDDEVERLADLVVENWGDDVIDQLKFKK